MNTANIRYDLFQSMQMIKSCFAKMMDPITEKQGITSLQIFVLMSIESGRVNNISSLSREMDMCPSNASTLCKKMEHDGLVKRERSKADERMVILTLTDEGKSVVALAQKEMKKIDTMLTKMPKEDLDTILRSIELTRSICEKIEQEA